MSRSPAKPKVDQANAAAAHVTRNAVVVIAVVAAGAALYWLRDILTPLALAIFLLIMIDGLARWVSDRTGLAGGWALAFSVVLITLGFAGAVWVLIDGVAGILSQASTLAERIDAIIADAARMARLEVTPTARDLLERLDLAAWAGRLAGQVQSVASGAFFVLVYLGFLMASRVGFKRKLVAMFPGRGERDEAVEIFGRIRSGVEGYLWVQTVTGLMIAAAAAVLMTVVGLDNVLFWTFVIFVVGYIPILGGAVAGLAPPLFALAQFPGYSQALILLIGLYVIQSIVGNFIQPRMQGDNQNIDPVVVLLALAFWGALWGVAGMFLSTPLAVMAIAILAQFQGTRWIAILLSGDGDPYPGEDADPAAA
ncbi:AI-2E family transporter [Brevundimonas sp. 2R-24]|uniref:AI-2E family transporter n=1 Tax=Peiella sedimenti TaxID=3061083 RepID=A0ABT8SKL3_9CAUL|nr:AI-2E family transporter [Caulobacteraceae bacterium XZ-24]